MEETAVMQRLVQSADRGMGTLSYSVNTNSFVAQHSHREEESSDLLLKRLSRRDRMERQIAGETDFEDGSRSALAPNCLVLCSVWCLETTMTTKSIVGAMGGR